MNKITGLILIVILLTCMILIARWEEEVKRIECSIGKITCSESFLHK